MSSVAAPNLTRSAGCPARPGLPSIEPAGLASTAAPLRSTGRCPSCSIQTVLRSRFDFDNAQGQTLSGRLEEPHDTPLGTVLFAHCFTCGKDVAAASRISAGLVDRGFAVLRFDFTGLGNSDGDFANTHFSSNVQDLASAARALSQAGKPPTVLVGHSLGGAAVLAAAEQVPSAKAVVTLAAPSTPDHVAHLLADSVDEIERTGSASVVLAGRTFRIEKQFLDDLKEQRQEERLRKLGRPLLILHSPRDELVDVDEARKIFVAAKHPKSFISLDDADHLLSRKADSRYAADVISAWASRYLPEPEPVMPQGESVRVAGLARLAARVEAGRHVLRVDEPKSVGGDDTGPTPYGLLLGSLGSCTALTLRMYANRKQWPLDKVEVRLEHARVHKQDADDPEGGSRKREVITRTLHIEGDLDATQRQRLREIADKCPVHRTLEACPEIVTEVE